MEKLEEDAIAPVEIDLTVARRGALDESMLRRFGTVVKWMLNRTFGNSTRPFRIRGTPRDLDSFAKSLGGEKKYMEAYLKYGLNDPRTLSNRHKLEAAIRGFESETGIKWPIK
jgi:hypothetical protein